jgi:hypothetical protein
MLVGVTTPKSEWESGLTKKRIALAENEVLGRGDECFSTQPREGKRSHRNSKTRWYRHAQVTLVACMIALSLWNMNLLGIDDEKGKQVSFTTKQQRTYPAGVASLKVSRLSEKIPPTYPGVQHDLSRKPDTLALLYPPGFLGGYRNQVIRLISLCVHARKTNLTQLLLPSLLWATQLNGIGVQVQWFTIPMEWVFDVEHWNLFSDNLPRLVENVANSDCWVRGTNESRNQPLNPLQRGSLQQGFLGPISNITTGFLDGTINLNPRRVDYYPEVEFCQHPVVYGGGRTYGRLWNDYISYRKNKDFNGSIPFQQDEWVLRALQPAHQWRKTAQECISLHTANEKYIALHARVELEIFAHACGREMEWNLTKIFQQVEILSENDAYRNVSGLFVAVSRAGMREEGNYEKFKNIADGNIEVLNRFVGFGSEQPALLGRNHLSVFECGEQMLTGFYAQHPGIPDHGALLQSVINFYIAVNADAFVGVSGSSYSTDVFTTRYHMGKGRQNFRYTKGYKVVPVENNGLPSPHFNCRQKK